MYQKKCVKVKIKAIGKKSKKDLYKVERRQTQRGHNKKTTIISEYITDSKFVW